MQSFTPENGEVKCVPYYLNEENPISQEYKWIPAGCRNLLLLLSLPISSFKFVYYLIEKFLYFKMSKISKMVVPLIPHQQQTDTKIYHSVEPILLNKHNSGCAYCIFFPAGLSKVSLLSIVESIDSQKIHRQDIRHVGTLNGRIDTQKIWHTCLDYPNYRLPNHKRTCVIIAYD